MAELPELPKKEEWSKLDSERKLDCIYGWGIEVKGEVKGHRLWVETADKSLRKVESMEKTLSDISKSEIFNGGFTRLMTKTDRIDLYFFGNSSEGGDIEGVFAQYKANKKSTKFWVAFWIGLGKTFGAAVLIALVAWGFYKMGLNVPSTTKTNTDTVRVEKLVPYLIKPD